MKKLIFIILDGLNYETSREMGYLAALVEEGEAASLKVEACLPTLSRPLYETLLTGLTPVKHGVVSNNTVRRSREENIFSLAKESNLKTAAAAYHWMSELYNRSPFNYIEDSHREDSKGDIQFGRFYFEDHYPDNHLVLDGEALRRKHSPDFLLIHPMNIDDAGHRYGSSSTEYRNSARKMDDILSQIMPSWIQEGYTVVVTSDHGMNEDRTHGGSSPQEREVPLYIIGSEFEISSDTSRSISQLQVAPILCKLLGIQRGKKMLEIDKSIFL